MKNLLKSVSKSFVIGAAFALGMLTMGIFAVSVTGTIKTWATGDTLTATDLNTTITSLKTAIEGIPNWTKAANGNDAYYTAGNVGIGTATPESTFQVLWSTTASYVTFGNSSGGLRVGALQSGSPFIGQGTIKTAADGNYIAKSAGASYGHSIISFDYNGTISFMTASNQADGTNLNGVFQLPLYLSTNGRVGMGTSTPAFPLQVGTSAANGNGAYVSTGGVWTNGSSKDSKKNIVDLAAKEAIDAFVKLEPKIYNYRNEENERYVGFLAEDVPELVATKDRKHLSPMDIAAVTVKVVQEQEKTIDSLKAENKKLRESVETLRASVETHGRASLRSMTISQRLEERLKALENLQMAKK